MSFSYMLIMVLLKQYIDETKHSWCSPDAKLISNLQKMVIGEEIDNLSNTQQSLMMIINQQISSLSMLIPEFSSLRAKTRVRLLQANNIILHRLILIKLLYEHVFHNNHGHESAIFHISLTHYWNEKTSSKSELTEKQRKIIIKKIADLINGDKNVFLFLFPILLFNNHGAKDINIGGLSSNQEQYQHLFEDYLLMNMKNNSRSLSAKMNIAMNLKHYLRQF